MNFEIIYCTTSLLLSNSVSVNEVSFQQNTTTCMCIILFNVTLLFLHYFSSIGVCVYCASSLDQGGLGTAYVGRYVAMLSLNHVDGKAYFGLLCCRRI